MKMLLIRDHLWSEYVEKKVPAASRQTADWLLKNNEALATIALGCDRSQHQIIRKSVYAHEAWKELEQHHERRTVMSNMCLLRKLIRLRLEEGGNLEDHLRQMEEMFELCDSSNMAFTEIFKIVLMTSSLPDSYDGIVAALDGRNESELTMPLVKQKLIDEYLRKKEKECDGSERLMYSKHSSKQNAQREKPQCWTCGSLKHFQNKCPQFDPKAQPKFSKVTKKAPSEVDTEFAGMSIHHDDSESAAITFMAMTGNVDDGWFLDSGATRHMCHTRSNVTKLRRENGTKIFMADGSSISEDGIGEALLTCENDRGAEQLVRVENVLLVPGLKANLLSVSQLVKNGFIVTFDNNSAYISKNKHVMAVADHVNGLFKIRSHSRALMTSTGGHKKDCIHQWHRRLGHRDYQVVAEIVRSNGLKLDSCGMNERCECCLQSKMARQPFPKTAEKWTTQPLQLIHSDLAGPIDPVSAGGSRYVLTLIDDYSRFTRVFLLQVKSDAAKRIQEYVREMETKYGRKPQIIRSDNGGEFTGHVLREFYRKEGITAQFTVPYTPSQNGVAERKNRSLIEMVRCMINDAGLPRDLWGEAIMTANFLQNRLVSNALPNGKTPFELWSGSPPDYRTLRVFGCYAWVQTPSVKRTKLDHTSRPMIFVGYGGEQKGFRFWDPELQKTVVSRDAVFLELGNGSKQLEQNYSVPNHSVPNLIGENTDEKSTGEMVDMQIQEEQDQQLRRSTRTTRGNIDPYIRDNYVSYGAVCIDDEPNTFNNAMKRSDSAQWMNAMKEEIAAMYQNKTWDLVDLPQGKNVIGSRWVYKLKTDADGRPTRYKARLVAQGFTQKYGVDYDEVFAPVVQATSIRLLLTLAGERKSVVRHVDVKSAFLNGTLDEEIYMKQPVGFEDKNSPLKVCRLKKSLYGLKQAARVWHTKLSSVLNQLRFERCPEDECLYIRRDGDGDFFILLHVDDMLLVSPSLNEAIELERCLAKSFDVTILGDVKEFLGMKVERGIDGSFAISQSGYIDKIIRKFGMENATPSKIPIDPSYLTEKDISPALPDNEKFRSLVGALLYAAVSTRLDIFVAASVLGRKVSKPSERDWAEAKRCLRYLKGTIGMCLELKPLTVDDGIVAYVDADWAGDRSDCKSNSGYVILFNGAAIDWSCRKQESVSTSSTEAEYISLSEACKQIKWIKRLVASICPGRESPIIVKEDNQSAIALVKGNKPSRRSKHIDTRFHFVRDLYATKVIELRYCPTESMVADMMTKPLGYIKLNNFRDKIGIRNREEEC